MNLPSTHQWTWTHCRHNAVACHVIVRHEAAVHVSFSAEANARARDFLATRGITVAPLRATDNLFLLLEKTLEHYLTGASRTFLPFADSPFWAAGTVLQRRVWQEIRRIPYGQTRTYGDLAMRLGNRHYARAVGQACHANPLALIVPCRRVVGTNSLGGFAGGVLVKKILLELEQQGRQKKR